MIVQLLTEHHLELLSLKGGCIGSYESTLVKISHCWKSHAKAQLCFHRIEINRHSSSQGEILTLVILNIFMYYTPPQFLFC